MSAQLNGYAEPTGPDVLFVDLDDTVRMGKAHLGRFVNSPDDVYVFPEAKEQLRHWRNKGGRVIGVTNQGGIGLGFMDASINFMIEKETIRQTGNNIDRVMTCMHKPDAKCFCRKPLPGLILQGVEWVRLMWSAPKASKCLMVGDMPTDAQAGIRAGIDYQCAECWRLSYTPAECHAAHSMVT